MGFTYWLLGQLDDKAEELSRSNGFMQTVQQVGGLMALNHFTGKLPTMSANAPPSSQCLVNLALVVLMVPCTALTWFFTQPDDVKVGQEQKALADNELA